jgi:hypothetical protein
VGETAGTEGRASAHLSQAMRARDDAPQIVVVEQAAQELLQGAGDSRSIREDRPHVVVAALLEILAHAFEFPHFLRTAPVDLLPVTVLFHQELESVVDVCEVLHDQVIVMVRG